MDALRRGAAGSSAYGVAAAEALIADFVRLADLSSGPPALDRARAILTGMSHLSCGKLHCAKLAWILSWTRVLVVAKQQQ